MLQKNIEKQERKEKRYPPIPFMRVGKSKKQKIEAIKNKYKNKDN